MNKKAITTPILILTSFAIMSLMFIFSSFLIFNAGEEYVIDNMADIGVDILTNETSLPAGLGVDTVNEVRASYSAFLFPYDLFFLAMWVSTFAFTVFSTFQTNKEGIFSFFGFLFVGSLLLLLITSYLTTYTDWFITEIFEKVFADDLVALPIFYFYLNNLGIINFVWWLVLILISVIDRNFISRTGEVQE